MSLLTNFFYAKTGYAHYLPPRLLSILLREGQFPKQDNLLLTLMGTLMSRLVDGLLVGGGVLGGVGRRRCRGLLGDDLLGSGSRGRTGAVVSRLLVSHAFSSFPPDE